MTSTDMSHMTKISPVKILGIKRISPVCMNDHICMSETQTLSITACLFFELLIRERYSIWIGSKCSQKILDESVGFLGQTIGQLPVKLWFGCFPWIRDMRRYSSNLVSGDIFILTFLNDIVPSRSELDFHRDWINSICGFASF